MFQLTYGTSAFFKIRIGRKSSLKLSKYNLIIWDDLKKQNILFNTLHGECFIADDKIVESIQHNNIGILSPDVINQFKEKSIIIEDDIDEALYVEYFHNKMKFNSDSLSFTILLTWACNLRCVYCYEGAGDIRNKSLNEEESGSIVKYIKKHIDMVRPHNVSIMLFGGEPLLNLRAGEIILEEIADYCKEKNVSLNTSIITNGVLLDNEKVEFLKKYNCKYVQITLDGVKEIHDKRRVSKDGSSSFDKIVDILKLLNNRTDFVKPLIRVNIDKNNINSTEELLSYLATEGLNTCGLDFGIVHGGTEACSAYSGSCFVEEELGELLSSLWELARKYGFNINPRPMRKFIYCGLNKENAYTIAPTLDVYKCWEQVGEEKHKIGNIEHNGNLKENLYSLIDWMSINPVEVAECKECVYLPACGGGCAARAYDRNGSYHGTGCFKVKGVVEKELLESLRGRKII